MTPEERARVILEEIVDLDSGQANGLLYLIEGSIAEAIQAEREACAKVAKQLAHQFECDPDRIAQAIRARTETKEK